MTAIGTSLRQIKQFATFGLARSSQKTDRHRLDRNAFEHQIEAEIHGAGPAAASPFALLYIDTGGLKDSNEAFKPELQTPRDDAIGARLSELLAPGDLVARFAEDAFAIRQANADARTSLALAQRILDRLCEAAFDLDPWLSRPTIGIALYPRDGVTGADIARHAEFALYRAKQAGGARIVLFDPQDARWFSLRQNFPANIEAAMANDDLAVAYQPVVSIASKTVVGLEALMRWRHPTEGLLSPEDFIPLAETCGVIVALGEWMLRRACQDARKWPGLRIAVNVSPVQFRHKTFVAMVGRVLSETGIAPERLELELTEGVLIQDAALADASIIELRSMGISIALDDFGTGYSSLIYLRQFAFDKIKIDKSFMEAVEPAGEGGMIVRSIVQLGQALGLAVTAEGIETEAQVAFLQNLGCDELQGFLFSAPVWAEEVDATLSALAWAAEGDGVIGSASAGRSVA